MNVILLKYLFVFVCQNQAIKSMVWKKKLNCTFFSDVQNFVY